ncbi:sensor histidine kinase [Rhodococcus kronopolitis]|uniref:histidine kinase n=1 Tax=Rhodococcus kronopolitis TaxID=1460226 RepID=A0ABV9FSI6_9NOCA
MTRAGFVAMPLRTAMPWIGHLVVTVVVVMGGALPDHPGGGFVWSPHRVLFNAVAAAILLGRNRAPFVVLPVVIALVGVSAVVGLFNPGLPVATAVAVYAVVLNTSRRNGLALTAVVAALMIVPVVVDGYNGFQSVLTVLLGGAVGEAVRTQRSYVAAVTERAERAERTREALARQRVAETRLAIARDLHDVVAHQISVINLHAGVAASALRDRPADAEKSLTIVRRASRAVLSEIGDLMATLRDPDAGTGPPGLGQLDDVVREFASHGMAVTVRIDGDCHDLPGTPDVTALRIIQEALTNAHKHGTGRDADVLVECRPHSLRVTVTNPTAPANTDGDHLGTRQGLIGMGERVESVRGTLTYGPNGKGMWILVADVPIGPVDNRTTTEGRS